MEGAWYNRSWAGGMALALVLLVGPSQKPLEDSRTDIFCLHGFILALVKSRGGVQGPWDVLGLKGPVLLVPSSCALRLAVKIFISTLYEQGDPSAQGRSWQSWSNK